MKVERQLIDRIENGALVLYDALNLVGVTPYRFGLDIDYERCKNSANKTVVMGLTSSDAHSIYFQMISPLFVTFHTYKFGANGLINYVHALSK